MVNTPEKMYEWTSGADKAGLHVIVHAIGDRAIGMLLDIYERVAKENGARDRRFRIEHAQHLRASDIPRFAQLGVIASMQPYHAIDDGRWAEQVIGKRIATTYAFRSLLDARRGSPSAATGSSRPRRRSKASTPPSRAARSTTRIRTAGCRSRRSRSRRRCAPTRRAPRTRRSTRRARARWRPASSPTSCCIDRDLFKIPPEQIRDAKVIMTVVGGKVVSGGWPAPAAAQ